MYVCQDQERSSNGRFYRGEGEVHSEVIKLSSQVISIVRLWLFYLLHHVHVYVEVESFSSIPATQNFVFNR